MCLDPALSTDLKLPAMCHRLMPWTTTPGNSMDAELVPLLPLYTCTKRRSRPLCVLGSTASAIRHGSQMLFENGHCHVPGGLHRNLGGRQIVHTRRARPHPKAGDRIGERNLALALWRAETCIGLSTPTRGSRQSLIDSVGHRVLGQTHAKT